MSVAIHSLLHTRLSYYTQTMTSSVKRAIESENLFSDSKTYKAIYQSCYCLLYQFILLFVGYKYCSYGKQDKVVRNLCCSVCQFTLQQPCKQIDRVCSIYIGVITVLKFSYVTFKVTATSFFCSIFAAQSFEKFLPKKCIHIFYNTIFFHPRCCEYIQTHFLLYLLNIFKKTVIVPGYGK